MPSSVIHVQHSDGSAARHVRVVLGFSTGMTKESFTDDYGDAVVEHASTGRAAVDDPAGNAVTI